jgi:Tfp pilus assembly protein PilF
MHAAASSTDTLLARAKRELDAGHPADALRTLDAARRLAPPDAEVWCRIGAATRSAGDGQRAIECFEQALAMSPSDGDLYVHLGISLCEVGSYERGIAHLRRACELAPRSLAAWFNLGEALRHDAQVAAGIAAQQRALSLDASCIPARLSLARLMASQGEVEHAVREFRAVLRQQPGSAKAWLGVANLKVVAFSAEDVARLQHEFRTADPRDARCPQLGFALAQALEGRAAYAEAFGVLRTANAQRHAQLRWDAAGEHRRVLAIERAWAGLEPVPDMPRTGRAVIAIASIPRSGSTLVEQILASHHAVEGANEITDLGAVIDAETSRRHEAFPLWMPMATAGDWARMGAAYLARTARWRAHKPRFTDKNLANWYLAGALLAMLPAARIVVVRRDPVETCLACYRQWFSGDAGFAYDLDEMAAYCIDFMRLTRFWLRKFPQRVFDLEYEKLVAEPAPTIRRLLDFLGLDFDPACLEFYKTPRAVLSAPSAAQVRQPLHDTARATRYGHLLDGLRQRLRAGGLDAPDVD